MIDWDSIVVEHGEMVWRTAYRLLGCVQDTQDCTQEAFVSALEFSRRQRVRDWPALLCHLATARAIDRLRKRIRDGRKNGEPADGREYADRGPGPVEEAEAAELSSRLRNALAQLPPRQAEVFALRFLDDLSYRSIGRTLGIKTNAVGVLLHDARTRLRKLLGDGHSGGDSR